MFLRVETLDHYDPLWGMPEYAAAGDAGFDLRAAKVLKLIDQDSTDLIFPLYLMPLSRCIIGTGLVIGGLPNDYELQVRPRSGLAAKHGLTVLNSPGTVDAGYRGEIGVILINHGRMPARIMRGDRIAQAVVNKIERVSFTFASGVGAESTERGAGGFGSTGVS